MTELTAPAGSSAVVERLPSRQRAATARHSSATELREDRGVKPARRRKRMINEQSKEASVAAVARLDAGKNLNGGPGQEDDLILPQLDEAIATAARAAQDYCSSMLKQMKVNINAALNYANGLTKASLSPDFVDGAAAQRREAKATSKGELLTPAKAAQEYRVRAFELITANVNATLEYAQQLASVKSPTEFIELSTNHARKNMELTMKHTAALAELSHSLATTNAERMTTSIARVFSRHVA
jgi:hypothetical protein